MKNLFLTGKVGSGKTTLLKNVLERINTSIGGFMTQKEMTVDGKNFKFVSLFDGREEYTFAHIQTPCGVKNIHVFKEAFDVGAVSIMKKSFEGREVIVLDELGFMESDCRIFQQEVNRLLSSDRVILGVIKDHDNEFLNSIRNRDDVRIVEVTQENRNHLLNELLDIISEFGCPVQKNRRFQWDKKRINWYNQALSYNKCNYPDLFIEAIKSYVGDFKGKTIIDIGAGTGAFAIPLSKAGAHITALDVSISMLDSLKENAEYNCLENINYILSPFESINVSKHDIAISAFSGGGTGCRQDLVKLCESINEYVFIISPIYNENDNFKGDILSKMLGRQVRKFSRTIMDTLSYLQNLNYSFEFKEIEYSFPQYFIDYQDAVDFFTCHFKLQDEHEVDIAKKFMNEYLIEVDLGYLFPNDKKCGFLAINVSETGKQV